MNNKYCNNCGKCGHVYFECKNPITSNGIISFRRNNETNDIEYLMIRRRHTLGLIDFLRGNYSVLNKEYIINMMKQMTQQEKEMISTKTFNELWFNLWGITSYNSIYRNEQKNSYFKFTHLLNGVQHENTSYNLFSLLQESNTYELWYEPEWGFPKGRRDNNENDFDCAIREFCEETGYNKKHIKHIHNLVPYEEVFMGSNCKKYKHKYYIVYMMNSIETPSFQTTEVSKMEWKSFDKCISSIRTYNLEKKEVLMNVHDTISNFTHIWL